MCGWTEIELSYHYGLNVFIPLSFEFESRLRNQRPCRGVSCCLRRQDPDRFSVTGMLPARFYLTQAPLRRGHPTECGLADSCANPEQPLSHEQSGKRGWGSFWKRDNNPPRSWLSMGAIETIHYYMSQGLCDSQRSFATILAWEIVMFLPSYWFIFMRQTLWMI